MRRATALGVALAAMLGLSFFCCTQGGRDRRTLAEVDAQYDRDREAELGNLPSCRRGPIRHEKRGKPMAWRATGATIAAANGTFEGTGTDLVNENGWHLFLMWDSTWFLAPAATDPAYGQVPYQNDGATLPGTWEALNTPPYSGSPAAGTAPTLAEAAVPVAGVSNPFGWAWPNWFGPSGGDYIPCPVAPCRATIQGREVVAMAYSKTVATNVEGLLLFDLEEKTWQDVPIIGALPAVMTSAGPMDLPEVPKDIPTRREPNTQIVKPKCRNCNLADPLMRIAIHECGHAVTALAVGLKVKSVYFTQNTVSGGYGGACALADNPVAADGREATAEDVIRFCRLQVAHMAGGAAAERQLLEVSGNPLWYQDQDFANLVLQLAVNHGADGQQVLDEALALAEAAVRDHEAVILQLARRMMHKGGLEGDEAANLFAAAQ
ncbi:MAG: hypothetical protein WCP21_03925 [Armatimonadota bacterium]